MSLVSLTGMFLLAGLVQEATQRGLSLSQVMMIMPLLIPNTLPYTIPATTLFATCVVYGRMAHDNEIVVLKSAGVNLISILKPALVLGLTTSSVTMALYYHLIPQTQQMMRNQLLSEGEEMLYGLLKKDRCMRFSNLPYVMYVREVQGKRLTDVIFKRRTKVNDFYIGYDLIARAREATLRLDLENNQLHVDMTRCVVYSEKNSVAEFQHKSFPMPLPESIFGKEPKTRPMALTWPELRERQIELDLEKASLERELEQAQQQLASVPVGSESHKQLTLHAFHLTNKVKDSIRNRWQVDAEIQMRPALAVGCLCFVLIGCPVGIWASRADYLSSFVICFLPTVFVYYPLLLCGSNLGKDGKMPMVPAVWAADVFLGMVALFLIWRVMRR